MDCDMQLFESGGMIDSGNIEKVLQIGKAMIYKFENSRMRHNYMIQM